MTLKQAGPPDVRPNTLRDQTAPNTFRSSARPGTGGAQLLNKGGGSTARRRRGARPQVSLRVYAAVAALAILLTLYLLAIRP